MEYTISKLAQLAGITTRTLRYYDEIGLLKPCRVSKSGYRLYGREEMERLQHIRFYRELNVPLAEIPTLLEPSVYNRVHVLNEHLAMLKQQRDYYDRLILTVTKTIRQEKGEIIMKDLELFEGLKKQKVMENEKKYGSETRDKYGDTAVSLSNENYLNLTQEEYYAMKNLEEQIRIQLEQAVKDGKDPSGAEGRAVAQLHKEWLAYSWPSYTSDAHRNLVIMYTEDSRFMEYYDHSVAGCALFLRTAVEHHIPAAD